MKEKESEDKVKKLVEDMVMKVISEEIKQNVKDNIRGLNDIQSPEINPKNIEVNNPEVVRVQINNNLDRDSMIVALANAGHHVWIEEEKVDDVFDGENYFVCFIIHEDNVN